MPVIGWMGNYGQMVNIESRDNFPLENEVAAAPDERCVRLPETAINSLAKLP